MAPASKTVEHVIKVNAIYHGHFRGSIEVWSDIVERRSSEPFTDCLVAYTSDPTVMDTVEIARKQHTLLKVTAWEGQSGYHLSSCEELS